MTRPFRLEEDERRYFVLRSEFFIRLVQSGISAQVVHDIMRNFGKLEDFAFFEGVRQGMAASVLAPAVDQNVKWFDLHPVDVHARVYGAAATPLVRVERSLVAASGSEHGYDLFWLNADPMEFAPLTLTEAIEKYGPDLDVQGAPRRPRRVEIATTHEAPPEEPPPVESDDFDPMEALAALERGDDPETVLGQHFTEGPDRSKTPLADLVELPDADIDSTGERPLERPDVLDRIRDVLQSAEPPKTWQDLILLLMREMRMDASYLDELMSAPMGMTVISQCNLFHLHPGAMPEVMAVPRPR